MTDSPDRKVAYEPLSIPRRILVWVFIVVAFWYLIWRLGTFNPDARAFSIVIYCAEVFGFATALLHFFMVWRMTRRVAPPAPPGLTVDVLIPTYNESLELVRRTVSAAVRMDYPHRTWLLDDGNRPEMLALAKEIGAEYLARSDNSHAKAGNLNNALQHASGQFVAILDADHAPSGHMLTHTLGYFKDEKVAFVQTPQDFFNLDSFQHRKRDGRAQVWTEQSLFFRVIQRGKDYWNAAFFCGSCAVMRRSALDAIGGIATGTITEDLHTSLRIHAHGYSSVYHAEPLAFGLAPETMKPFLSQRVRWGQGAMHVWRKEGILFKRGLTLAQRLNYFASVLTYFDGWQKGVFYIAPVIVLTTGTLPILVETRDFLIHFLPYYLLTFWVFEEVGRGFGRSLMIEQYNMARFAAFAWATLALLFGSRKFKVTVKGSLGERWQRYASPQLTVLFFNVVAIPVGILLYLNHGALPFEGMVANIVWAGINSALALAVVLFARTNSARKRLTYRFQIPLPARFLGPDGKYVVGVIDDISPTGFRFYGTVGGLGPVGTTIAGKIFLPDGPLRIVGEIRSLVVGDSGDVDPSNKHYVKAIGCIFLAHGDGQRRIEDFLYGSDLQWKLNRYSDQIWTPLTNFMRSERRSTERFEPVPEGHWLPASIHGDGQPGPNSIPGLLRCDPRGKSLRVISFEDLGSTARIELKARSRRRKIRQSAQLQLIEVLDQSSSPMYLYAVTEAQDVAPSDAADTVGGSTLEFVSV